MTARAKSKKRLLIFIIAYRAEATLAQVLDRVPAAILDEYDCEVLVVDDASTDRTFEIGRAYRDAHPEMRITVLRNEFNQGYGGNQKIGYAYAIEEKFHFVAMVHGDGQYAPEELPRLVAPLRDGEADAVFGSRMLTSGGALRGGMPLYKFVGNKILTRLQNTMLGTKFSEFHSGYRIYSTAALKTIPFKLNSNQFDFDTEIILQLLNAKQRILELPIPTYYGDEISRVNGMKYARDILRATARNAIHRSGLLYQRKFDTNARDNTHYDLKLGYASSHSYALDAVPTRARVLDLGGGPAGMAAEFAKKGCLPAVVDRYDVSGKDNPLKIPVHVQDLDAPLKFDSRPYEYLTLLDIIEHLKDPEDFLDRLRSQFDYSPKRIVLTTPNVGFVVQRLMLLLGEFNYGKFGILDRTHTRLFTFRGAEQLMKDTGFVIREVRGIPAPFPKVLGNGFLGKAALNANLAAIRVSKTLFSYQILIIADATPDVEFLLRDAREKSAAAEIPTTSWTSTRRDRDIS